MAVPHTDCKRVPIPQPKPKSQVLGDRVDGKRRRLQPWQDAITTAMQMWPRQHYPSSR